MFIMAYSKMDVVEQQFSSEQDGYIFDLNLHGPA
jgi:hypothetical protein